MKKISSKKIFFKYSISFLLAFAMMLSVFSCNQKEDSEKSVITGAQGEKGDPGEKGKDGKDGIGISSLEINEFGQLLVTYTSGETKNLGFVAGESGKDGENGIGIAKAEINSAGELIITYTNNTSESLGTVVGEDGKNGMDGTGLSGIEINQNGELTVSFSDGTSKDLGVIVGKNGENGKTPVFKLENNDLKVSYDNGASWESVGIITAPKGDDGIGISNISISDGKLIVTLTDGTVKDLGTVVHEGSAGEPGADGEDGVGILDVELNQSGELIVKLTNGTEKNLGNIKGDKGDKGDTGDTGSTGTDGVGIKNITQNPSGDLVIELTNGQNKIFTFPKSESSSGGNVSVGNDGVGISDAKINSSGELVITLTNGAVHNLGIVVGATGEKGDKGDKGDTGVGIKDAEINANGELIIYYTDNTSENLGKVVGENGDIGLTGPAGEKGDDGRGIESVKIINGAIVITYTDKSSDSFPLYSQTAPVLPDTTLPSTADRYTGYWPASKPDYSSWYNEATGYYEINSANRLAELSSLVGTYGETFSGKKLLLTTDIIWNEGIISVDNNGDPIYNGAPASSTYINEWIPIGSVSNIHTSSKPSTENQFAGDFYGGGHTVSGLFVNDRNVSVGFFRSFNGAHFEDLKIVNSYFGGNVRSGAFFGFARPYGETTFEKLYSNAYVVTNGANSRSGGIGGMLRPTVIENYTVTFNECWFDGTVWCTTDGKYNGGILGAAVLDASSASKYVTLSIKKSLVTADFYLNTDTISLNKPDNYVGLAVGLLFKGKINISDFLAVVEDTNITTSNGFPSISDTTGKSVISTYETGATKQPNIANYTNVYFKAKGLFNANKTYITDPTAEPTVSGAPISDPYFDEAKAKFSSWIDFSGSIPVMKGYGISAPEGTDGLKYYPLSNGTYGVMAGDAKYYSDTVVIPSTFNGIAVTQILPGGFADSPYLTSVIIPDSVVTIAQNAFRDCPELMSVTIPSSVTAIGANAFANCTKLEQILFLGTYAEWSSINLSSSWNSGACALLQVIFIDDHTGMTPNINGTPITNYTIVIPENFLVSDYRLAVYLKKQLDTLYGSNVAIATDKSTYANEILVGNTKRTTAAAPIGENEYAIEIKDGTLQLQASSMYAYEELLNCVTKKIFRENTVEIFLSEGLLYKYDVTEILQSDDRHYTLERDGDVRIMFFNMWGNSTLSRGHRDQKQMLSAEVVNAYHPDVVGFQEFNDCNRNDGWYSIDTLLVEKFGYAEVDVSSFTNTDDQAGGKLTNDGSRDNNNFTPIFYDPNEVTVYAKGYQSYDSAYNDYGSKSYTWAVFTDKDTGKRFGVISTHFWYAHTNTNDNLARMNNAKLCIAQANTIISTYNCPVFLGGDLNMGLNSSDNDPYKLLTQASGTYSFNNTSWTVGGFTDVQVSAKRTEDHKASAGYPIYQPMFVKGTNISVSITLKSGATETRQFDNKAVDNSETYTKCDTNGDGVVDTNIIQSNYIGMWINPQYPSTSTTYADAIDHIFVKNHSAISLNLFEIVDSTLARLCSDHCPIFVDFSFK